MPVKDWSLILIAIVWCWGMLSMRKRRASWTGQLLFTLGCWSGILLGLLPSRASHYLLETRIGRGVIIIVLITITGAGFLARRKYIAFVCFWAGMTMVYYSFFAGLLYFYPLLVGGFLLIFGSLFTAFMRKPRQHDG